MTKEKLSDAQSLLNQITWLKDIKERYEYFLELIEKGDCDNWHAELIGFGSLLSLHKEFVSDDSIILILENALVEIRKRLTKAEKEFQEF